MKTLQHLTNSDFGLEVLKVETETGVAVIFRDTDADELIERRNYPAAIAHHADTHIAELTKGWPEPCCTDVRCELPGNHKGRCSDKQI